MAHTCHYAADDSEAAVDDAPRMLVGVVDTRRGAPVYYYFTASRRLQDLLDELDPPTKPGRRFGLWCNEPGTYGYSPDADQAYREALRCVDEEKPAAVAKAEVPWSRIDFTLFAEN